MIYPPSALLGTQEPLLPAVRAAPGSGLGRAAGGAASGPTVGLQGAVDSGRRSTGEGLVDWSNVGQLTKLLPLNSSSCTCVCSGAAAVQGEPGSALRRRTLLQRLLPGVGLHRGGLRALERPAAGAAPRRGPGPAQPHVGRPASGPAGGHRGRAAARRRRPPPQQGDAVWVKTHTQAEDPSTAGSSPHRRVCRVFLTGRPSSLQVQRARCPSRRLGPSAGPARSCRSPPVSGGPDQTGPDRIRPDQSRLIKENMNFVSVVMSLAL